MNNWQQQLHQAFTDPLDLLRYLQLDNSAGINSKPNFPCLVPRSFAARMEPGNLDDPLLKQVLPLSAESKITSGFTTDPLNEGKANPLPGLLHKYCGRVLLTVTGACAINCRYCFRRHFSFADNSLTADNISKICQYIASDFSIHEVILSGGEPLMLADNKLAELIEPLMKIKQLKRLRIHSRMAVVLPSRITTEFIDWFGGQRLQAILVLHCNHASEIDSEVAEAMLRLRNARITLLNQSVLLRGVNDQAAILSELSEKLFAMGVLPYYLHLLDKVQGAAHFYVPADKAKQLHQQLQQQLPGYLVPKLVTEQAGELAKVMLT